MVKRTCLWLLACLLPLPGLADTVGRVVAVNEGDSLTVLFNERERVKIRLLGIDAPDSHQDFAKQSQSSLSAYASDRDVRVEEIRKGPHGQAMARIWAPESGCSQPACPKTVDLGLAQVAAGMAWHDPRNEREMSLADRQRYAEAEFMAKVRRLGLWSGKNPRAPWALRQHRLEE